MRARHVLPAIAAAALVASGVVAPAHAAQKRGDLDTSWGNGGIATTAFPAAEFATTRDSIVQADGKVIVVGTVGDNDYSTFAIARFTTDGNLDPTFSGDGMIQVGFMQEHASARSVAIDSQGRLLIAGVTSPALELDGPDTRLALVRLLPNGVPDPAFGDLGNGRVRISFAARVTDGRGVAIASGDRPVVVGTEVSGGIPSMVLYRFTAAGQPDNAFDGNGHLAILSGTRTEGRKLAISSDVVYATGFREVALGVDQPVIAKILGSGTPDATFGASGVQPLALQGTSNYGVSIALPPTNPARISIGVDSYDLAGNTLTPRSATTSMTGVLSADYGVGGVFTGASGQQLRDAAVGSDGSSLLVSANFAGDSSVTAVRPDGSQDTSFAGSGSTSPLPKTEFTGRSVSIATDGGIIVGGNMVGVAQMGIVKLHGTAVPDPTPTPPPTPPVIRGLTVKKASLNVSIAAQAEGLTYTARKMKPNGTAGKVTASGDLPPGTKTLRLRTSGVMHGIHLSLAATGPGGASPATTVVWGRRITGRIEACKPVRVTQVAFGPKSRVHFTKRDSACARLIVDGTSKVVRKGKTSVQVPAATDRAVFRAGRARTVLVLG